jgi:hypothetical protein
VQLVFPQMMLQSAPSSQFGVQSFKASTQTQLLPTQGSRLFAGGIAGQPPTITIDNAKSQRFMDAPFFV